MKNNKYKHPKYQHSLANYVENTIDKLIETSDINPENDSELSERVLIYHYLPTDAKVLEIGGGWGMVSREIRKKIPNKDIVIIEPHHERANNLIKDKFNVFVGLISNTPLKYNGYLTENTFSMEKECFKDYKSQTISNITTIQNLEKMYNIKFNALVVDCEGALPQIINDNPDILEQITYIQMEYDWGVNECTEFRNMLIKKNFTSIKKLPLHWKPSHGAGALDENNELVGHEVLMRV